MKLIRSLLVFLVFMLVLSGSCFALPVSTSDLWDVSQGTTITSTSGPLYYSSGYRSYVENIFGASGGVAGDYTLFKDYMSPGYSGGSVPSGYTHFVEWNTSAAITLRSFNLVAYNEGMDRRAFSHFELYYKDSGGDWQSIFAQDFATTASNPYGYGGSPTYNLATNWLELEVDLSTAVFAEAFRAEFIQAPWTDSRAIGPRVWELDGYNTFLDGSVGNNFQPIPEPSTFFLLVGGLAGLAFTVRRRKKE